MKAKKVQTSSLIILLVLILTTLLGYYLLVQRNDKEKLSSIKQKNENITQQDPVTKTSGKIYCIGDSTTLGTPGNTNYPTILSTLTKKEVMTYGGKVDTSMDISARLGGYKLYVNNIVIPKDSDVSLELYNNDGKIITPFKNVGSTFNPVRIGDIEGILKYDAITKKYIFTRSESGDELRINEKTIVQVNPLDINKDEDIFIIWAGHYDPAIQDEIFKTITYEFQIIKNLDIKNYIILGLTSRERFENVDSMNNVLKENFSDHYLDIRAPLLQNGLKDSGLEATEQDKKDIALHKIPNSLMVDNLNGNSYFNEIVAKLAIDKMIDLQYLKSTDLINN